MKGLIKHIIWFVVRICRLDVVIARSKNRLLRKGVPRHTYYRPEQYDFAVGDGLVIRVDRSDYTQWRVFGGRLFEPDNLLPFLIAQKKKYILFDIGANIGAFSILLSRYLGQSDVEVHFFEPNQRILPTLNENVRRFQLSRPGISAEVCPCAVGEKKGVARLSVAAGHSGASSLVLNSKGEQQMDVGIVALDDYVDDHAIESLDFMQIDVESYEPVVFKGARRTIARFRPLIYLEYSKAWFDVFGAGVVEELADFLNSLQYTFLSERGNAMDPMEFSVSHLSAISRTNILAVPAAVDGGRAGSINE